MRFKGFSLQAEQSIRRMATEVLPISGRMAAWLKLDAKMAWGPSPRQLFLVAGGDISRARFGRLLTDIPGNQSS